MTIPPDAPVPADTLLYRRIHPRQLVADENRNCRRISKAAFQDPQMSVALSDALEDAGLTPADVLSRYPDRFLASLTARFVTEHEQEVVRTPEKHDPAHGEVVGHKPRPRARLFSRTARWVIKPSDACE